MEFKDVKIDGEEVSEEQQAIDELAQIRFDPSMLEELNRIVDDATLGASRSSPRGEDSKMTSSVVGERDADDAGYMSGNSESKKDMESVGAPSASPSVSPSSQSVPAAKLKMGESAGLASMDAQVDDALVGCIEMAVADDGSLEPASFTVDRKGDVIVRNVNSMLDKKRKWIVNGRNLGKVLPPPTESKMSQHEWQESRITRFLEDLNTHRLKVAALYLTGLKFSRYNSERIGKCLWEDTGIKREGKFKFLIDIDTAFLRYSEATINSLYKVVSPSVSGYCALKRIVLTQCRLGLNGTRTVVNACYNNIFVEELVVSGNNCTDSVMPDLVKTLQGSANRFRLLGIGSNSLTGPSMESLAAALTKHPYLKELHLSGNPIGDEGASYLFRALRDNMVCEVLNLSNCDVMACPFAGELRIMGQLAELNLSQNQISDRGVADLSDALEACVCLRHLDLSNNYFGGKHAVKVGEMLEHNKGLLSLSLSSNHAIYQVWNSIAVGLMKNRTLMRLNLTLCDINLQAAERIHESLAVNNVCTVDLDLNPIPDTLRLRPRDYVRGAHSGEQLAVAALPLARNAPGQALVAGQIWRRERLQKIMVSKDAVLTVERLQDPNEREPLGWDRETLNRPPVDDGDGGGGVEDEDEEDKEGLSLLQNSIHGEPSLFSGSLSLSALEDGTVLSLDRGGSASPDKSLLESLVPGSKDASPAKPKKRVAAGGDGENGEDGGSVAGLPQFGDESSVQSADMVSVGGKDARKMADLKDKLKSNANNDNQGRLILSVCYGRASEKLGTIEVDIHTTYPEAKELITPLVRKYLAALGNLQTADTLIEGFEVLDPGRKVVHGEKATVRSVWTEASVNDHNIFVRPANWIGMIDDEEEQEIEEDFRKNQGKYVSEEFTAVQYDNDAFYPGNGEDDMSAMSDPEGMFDDSQTYTTGSYQSQKYYFGEAKKKKVKEEKWV